MKRFIVKSALLIVLVCAVCMAGTWVPPITNYVYKYGETFGNVLDSDTTFNRFRYNMPGSYTPNDNAVINMGGEFDGGIDLLAYPADTFSAGLFSQAYNDSTATYYAGLYGKADATRDAAEIVAIAGEAYGASAVGLSVVGGSVSQSIGYGISVDVFASEAAVIKQRGNTTALKINKYGVGAGSAIGITNSGTGDDISGSGNFAVDNNGYVFTDKINIGAGATSVHISSSASAATGWANYRANTTNTADELVHVFDTTSTQATAHLLSVKRAGAEKAYITGDGGAVLDGALTNISESKWRIGGEVLNLDFTGSDYDTKAECQAVGMRFSDSDSPFPTTLKWVASGSWGHVGGGGWVPTAPVNGQGPAMLIPVSRGANWELELVYYISGVGITMYELAVGYIAASNHVGASALSVDNNGAVFEYQAFLETNDGDDTYTTRHTGNTISAGGQYTINIRCINGAVGVWDDQDNSWHDYEGRQSTGVAYTPAYAFVQFYKNAAAAFSAIQVRNLKLTYLL